MSTNIPIPKVPCPMCGESLPLDIKTCPACGELVSRKAKRRIPGELAGRFRRHIRGLAGVWFVLGIFNILLGLFGGLSSSDFRDEPVLEHTVPGDVGLIAFLLCSTGFLWLISAFTTSKKWMWGVILGLVLSYLSFFDGLFSGNFIGLAIYGLIIVQGHRVQGMAREIRNRGFSPSEVD